MNDSHSLLEAVDALGRELDRRQPGFGAAPRPRSLTLRWVSDQMCPRRADIKRITSAEGTEIAALLVDAIITAYTGVPWVGAQIARLVTRWGVDKFCENPDVGLTDATDSGTG